VSSRFSIERIDAGHARVSGRIGFDEAAAAPARGGELYAGGGSAVAVDVGALQDVDSATLAVLLDWAAQARRAGTVLSYTGASAGLRALAQLCDSGPLLGIGGN
jgi:ABC-type transporter Mla MlaB component